MKKTLSFVDVFIIFISLFIGSLGMVFYCGVEVIVAVASLTLLGAGGSILFLREDFYAKKVFWFLLSLGILGVLVSNYYRLERTDLCQNELDAFYFHDVSTKIDKPIWYDSVDENAHEYRLATATWMVLYRMVDSLGFSMEPFWGQYLNVILMAIGGVFCVKSVEIVFPGDNKKADLAVKLISFCGLVYLFGTIMLRDVFIFVYDAALVYFYSALLISGKFINWFFIIIISVFGWFTLNSLRGGMEYLPLLLLSTYLMALLYKKCGVKALIFALFFGGVAAWTLLGTKFASDRVFEKAIEYSEMVQSGNSLGFSYIVNTPLYIRWITGFIYLLIAPIPFFYSLLDDSSYNLFKGLWAIWLVFVVPAIGVGCFELLSGRSSTFSQKQNSVLCFAISLFFANFFTVAISTLETRHIVPSLPAVFLIATCGFCGAPSLLKFMRFLWWGGVGSIYFMWMVLKI